MLKNAPFTLSAFFTLFSIFCIYSNSAYFCASSVFTLAWRQDHTLVTYCYSGSLALMMKSERNDAICCCLGGTAYCMSAYMRQLTKKHFRDHICGMLRCFFKPA
jgi:hypothetical protein